MAFFQAIGNFLQGALRNAFPLLQVGGQLAIINNQQKTQQSQIEVTKRNQDNHLEIAKMRVDEVRATLAAKGVELQAQLAEKAKDRELTVQENAKNRALTEFLKKLDIEAQMIIHKDNIEMQKWRVEKEKELLLLRLDMEGQNQIALSLQQLKNAIAQMKEKRKIDNSPIRNLACDLVEEWERLDDPCILVMLYSPPVIHHETSALVTARTPQDFPDCEYELEHDLLHFQMFYNSKGRPIVLKTAEWISKYNRGTAAISPIYSEAYMIPTVIMDIAANNDKAFFNIAYWEPHFKKYEYFPATSKPLSWRNLAENTVAYFSIASQLWLGILADLHYLIHVPIDRRQTPLLPSLLPDLISSLPEAEQTELIKIVISHYESVYSALAELQPLLIADLRLDLAIAFSQLPSQIGAKSQLQASMHNWLRMYNIRVEDDFDVLITSVDSLLSISDQAYVDKLNVCLSAIGETRQLNIATSCYQRGIRRNQAGEYGAARADFDQVISLNPHADAYFQRGYACLKLKDYGSSIADLDQAAMLQPQRAEIYEYRGDAYLGLTDDNKRFEKALANYNQAIHLGSPTAETKRDRIQAWLNSEAHRQQLEKEAADLAEAKRRKQLKFELPDNGGELTFKWITAGKLIMEGNHEITIDEFRMGEYPITQRQYKAIMGTNPSHFTSDYKDENDKPCLADDRPVETVKWGDAKTFCEKVSALPIFKDAKLKVCLPSETQWEYACRDGADPKQKTKFWFGNNDGELPTHAWYNATKNCNSMTHSVKEREDEQGNKNASTNFGLVDMHGNVWEWCADNWTSVSNLPKDGKAYTDDGDSGLHAVRGGAWCANADYCGSASRNYYTAIYKSNLLGFRVVLVEV